MVGRYLGLLAKDTIYAYRNYCFHIVIFLALIFASVINFVVPEDMSIKPAVYYNMGYNGKFQDVLNTVIEEMKAEHNNIFQVGSSEEIVNSMTKSFNSIGMDIRGKDDKLIIGFVMHGYENDKIINSLILSMKDQINKVVRGEIEIDTKFIKNNIEQSKIPANKNMLPLFLVMEPTMLGFVMIASLIFMEKDEGTIKSYVVSPGRLSEYLASKITIMAFLGILGLIISTTLVMGFNVNYLNLIVLLMLGSIFTSSLGLIVASFFKNLSQSMIWVVVISLLLGLPITTYLLPSFAPIYIKILPTYFLLFAVREAVFPSGNGYIISSTILLFAVLTVVGYTLALYVFKLNLAKTKGV
ncbi:ABC transporter permease [Lutispora sp.]|uniref:ABC transporter permease n=1 Tax=Lutispora sp. TaxID=2828727 RepID=UPI002B2127CE|nr:ABC transporter permease [Lutispora sp.]MEA4962237.1 ABC transporter permease [Lutispora sp.]